MLRGGRHIEAFDCPYLLAAVTLTLALGLAGPRCGSAEEVREADFSVSPRIDVSTLLGDADPDEALPMSMTLHVQHRDDLDMLIAEQQRRGSGIYRQWLNPDEFAARYAVSADTYSALADWLRQQGFAVRTWQNRLRIDFTGTVDRTNRTFGVRIRKYDHHGRRHLANATAPQLPVRFADMIQSARLNTFPLAEPLVRLTGNCNRACFTKLAPRGFQEGVDGSFYFHEDENKFRPYESNR